jgi:hypothetical protein
MVKSDECLDSFLPDFCRQRTGEKSLKETIPNAQKGENGADGTV